MERTQKIEEAWAWARRARLDTLQERRERLASPGAPFKARPGQEEALEKADDAIFALSTILDELEAAYVMERKENAGPRRSWPTMAAGFLLSLGLAILATLGFAAACIVVRASEPITQASAVAGVALSLGWAVKSAGK